LLRLFSDARGKFGCDDVPKQLRLSGDHVGNAAEHQRRLKLLKRERQFVIIENPF
jgi:hypothetical protein